MRRPRRTYTDEERAAAKQRDAAALELGDALCADPLAWARRVLALLSNAGPKLLSYSPRNVAMLIAQAEARGMPLREVDSLRGWRARGRGVRRGEHGLRIVAPVGVDAEPVDADRDAAPAHDAEPEDQDGPPAAAARPRFRLVSVFEVSQTHGVEDIDGEPPALVAPDPVGAFLASLERQIVVPESYALSMALDLDDAAGAETALAAVLAQLADRDAAPAAR